MYNLTIALIPSILTKRCFYDFYYVMESGKPGGKKLGPMKIEGDNTVVWETQEAVEPHPTTSKIEVVRQQFSKSLFIVLFAVGSLGISKYVHERFWGEDTHVESLWENPDFFQEPTYVLPEVIAPGVEIRKDGGRAWYVVQPGDSKALIAKKLSQIPEYAYLADPAYGTHQIKGFNIANNQLKPGMEIPIPVDLTQRRVGVQEYVKHARDAVKEMCEHEVYGAVMRQTVKRLGEDAIVQAVTAYARCETAQDHQRFSDWIGETELHRREPHHRSFSFSHTHVLLSKRSAGKTALANLGLSPLQTYHPRNGVKLTLAFIIEKTGFHPSTMLDLSTSDRITHASGLYNGKKFKERVRVYAQKLSANYAHIGNVMNGEVHEINPHSLRASAFSAYHGINSKGMHVLLYTHTDEVGVSAQQLLRTLKKDAEALITFPDKGRSLKNSLFTKKNTVREFFNDTDKANFCLMDAQGRHHSPQDVIQPRQKVYVGIPARLSL